METGHSCVTKKPSSSKNYNGKTLIIIQLNAIQFFIYLRAGSTAIGLL
jgi:hypothetical protein